MPPRYKEASFPVTYREAHVGQVMRALYRLRSITIHGLAGMGKSNVVRFVVSHEEAQHRYLKERAADYVCILVDCVGLPDASEASILSEIAVQLAQEGITVSPQLQTSQDARQVLRQQILSMPADKHLVLILDDFDEAAAGLNSTFYNFLAHLRNARPRGNLMVFFATRRPLGSLYGLQELMDDSCFVGPLSREDALGSIRRDEARLGGVFSSQQREALIAVTGGHPGFLKNACELAYDQGIDLDLPGPTVAQQLLASAKIENLCRELWNDLKPEEQAALRRVAAGQAPSASTPKALLAYLEQSGLLVTRRDGDIPTDPAIFCPLFDTFVRRMGGRAGPISYTVELPNRVRIKTALGEEPVPLQPKVFALMAALVEKSGQVVTKNELIDHVYPGEKEGVSDEALSQLVKRLRKELGPVVGRLIEDPDYEPVETIRDVGFRLNIAMEAA